MPNNQEQETRELPKGSLQVSIVIPVYNEEDILRRSVCDLVNGCDAHDIPYELVLCENGSTDRTVEIAEKLCEELAPVRLLRYPEPNYGGALNAGIQSARGENIICFEIDFYDIPFFEISNVMLKKYDAVIGSKRSPGARDRRPWIRRLITWGFNTFLRIFYGFKGTDTHGIKAFRAAPAKRIAAGCQTGRDIFTTELVIRMERADLRMCEIPLEIVEIRPAPINIMKRVPGTLKNLWRLWKATRNTGRSEYALDRINRPKEFVDERTDEKTDAAE
ncbi:MAG TPA: glycosyltransferase [Gammaproteobacteria bacterium]|jgi:glycosyltransferase involved in cell wall biosynthesis|nr:glycosyltransferase [Gammaproteobacteria bacterium]HJP39513.1 glycosyltransferase [Gammaproteobacteria bacterium]